MEGRGGMSAIRFTTVIRASPKVCFDLSRSVDLHKSRCMDSASERLLESHQD